MASEYFYHINAVVFSLIWVTKAKGGQSKKGGHFLLSEEMMDELSALGLRHVGSGKLRQEEWELYEFV